MSTLTDELDAIGRMHGEEWSAQMDGRFGWEVSGPGTDGVFMLTLTLDSDDGTVTETYILHLAPL